MRERSRWDDLLREAFKLIDGVNKNGNILGELTFGGGTAMMHQIDHRESHDIDLFLDDPQLLSIIRAVSADMQYGIGPHSYAGNENAFVKLTFHEVGEIDFVVVQHVTANPAKSKNILGRDILMETIPEIIAKKIVYRGKQLRPRDVFDIAAASESGHREAIEEMLTENPEEAETAYSYLSQQKSQYVGENIRSLQIRDKFKFLIPEALSITKGIISRSLNDSPDSAPTH